jgi:hypothetical protein
MGSCGLFCFNSLNSIKWSERFIFVLGVTQRSCETAKYEPVKSEGCLLLAVKVAGRPNGSVRGIIYWPECGNLISSQRPEFPQGREGRP